MNFALGQILGTMICSLKFLWSSSDNISFIPHAKNVSVRSRLGVGSRKAHVPPNWNSHCSALDSFSKKAEESMGLVFSPKRSQKFKFWCENPIFK